MEKVHSRMCAHVCECVPVRVCVRLVYPYLFIKPLVNKYKTPTYTPTFFHFDPYLHPYHERKKTRFNRV